MAEALFGPTIWQQIIEKQLDKTQRLGLKIEEDSFKVIDKATTQVVGIIDRRTHEVTAALGQTNDVICQAIINTDK